MPGVNKAILTELYLVDRLSIPQIAAHMGLAKSAARSRLLDAGGEIEKPCRWHALEGSGGRLPTEGNDPATTLERMGRKYINR